MRTICGTCSRSETPAAPTMPRSPRLPSAPGGAPGTVAPRWPSPPSPRSRWPPSPSARCFPPLSPRCRCPRQRRTRLPPTTPASSPAPTGSTKAPGPRYAVLDELPAEWGDVSALPAVPDGWKPLAYSLACNRDGFTGTPPFSFEALAELDVGRSGALAGGRYQSVLRFVDDAAAGLFVSELVTQAQGCVDSPGDGAGDGTRDRWTVTSTPDGVAITLVTEVSEGGVWTRHPLATEEHLLFRRDGNAVAMASGRTDAMGPTPEVLDDQLDAAVAALLGR